MSDFENGTNNNGNSRNMRFGLKFGPILNPMSATQMMRERRVEKDKLATRAVTYPLSKRSGSDSIGIKRLGYVNMRNGELCL